MPRLAMTPTSNPTMKPLTCDPLNSGVSEGPRFFWGLVRLVALPVLGRLRLVLGGAVAHDFHSLLTWPRALIHPRYASRWQ